MKTFNKKRAVKFAFHDPFSSSISCYFDDFSPRKVINFYHQIIIQLINTFQPLFDKLFRYIELNEKCGSLGKIRRLVTIHCIP